ncbi:MULTISPECIES: FkbM family methyltransferase [Paracoccaceae]|jgi:FkbM family methyltransferase|uniref:FkbM family methyltransferase n=1 Tax=Rhodobacterales TaxID=204455 RepID=UPI001B2E79D6|nr:FkbM family methyltransferase [Boseongicola sp. H5]MBO6605047.1 FkbM family methyltransferase [Roseicyclus sp.]MBO6626585.1 FkbM family methyltransferase [Roseicyclus sp.]MBO6924279.1 FkbM family methyltransferase [Roseicyclus sp.]
MSLQPQDRIQQALFAYFCDFDAEALLERFHEADQASEPGIVRNFLGTRIAPDVFPPILTPMAGMVEPVPHPGNWHADIAEWAAALRSVALACGTYRIVELGCGWGCWIANMGVAARRRGLDLDLIGIEADRYHLASAEKTLRLNGFTASDYRLIHGVAGPRRGTAIFPIPEEDGTDWGGAAIFDPSPERLAGMRQGDRYRELPSIPLSEIVAEDMVDLLHIDIQGAEFDYVDGCFADISAYVKRVLIGTHSRVIEGRLFSRFLEKGWHLEMERPAIAPPVGGDPTIQIDGVQLWANPVTLAQDGIGS